MPAATFVRKTLARIEALIGNSVTEGFATELRQFLAAHKVLLKSMCADEHPLGLRLVGLVHGYTKYHEESSLYEPMLRDCMKRIIQEIN